MKTNPRFFRYLFTVMFLAPVATMILMAAAPAPTWGEKIVANYAASSKKEKQPYPGDATKCFAVAHSRADKALSETCKKNLPKLTAFAQFDRLWASKIDPKTSWVKLPANHRGNGAPGALVAEGYGTLLTQKQIWDGELKPGALLQVWKKKSDFARVKDGDAPEDIGHSFIFLKYVKDGAKIAGMEIADQGTGWDQASSNSIQENDFGYWVAVNISCSP